LVAFLNWFFFLLFNATFLLECLPMIWTQKIGIFLCGWYVFNDEDFLKYKWSEK
jgi:hypothetical protein